MVPVRRRGLRRLQPRRRRGQLRGGGGVRRRVPSAPQGPREATEWPVEMSWTHGPCVESRLLRP
eukprot:6519368-Lingulodinium_polyedra.AAC.1